jgi:catechol 2,3-dioxygenase
MRRCQRKTLRVREPFGLPIEFCSSMPTLPWFHSRTAFHKGGAGLRFDHTQVQVPDVLSAVTFYADIGFMVSDYSVTPAGDLVGAFLRRKNNPHDLVMACRRGPRLHHFGYIVDKQNLLRAGDVASSLGYRQHIEFGPSRHGQDHASFVYMRDPDGHRIELLSHPIQIVDLDSTPICRDITDREQFVPWGQAAPTAYLEEASEFPGEALVQAVVQRTW